MFDNNKIVTVELVGGPGQITEQKYFSALSRNDKIIMSILGIF